MSKLFKQVMFAVGVALLPTLAFAQISGGSGDTVETLGTTIIGLLNRVAIPIIVALAMVYFLIGVFKYLLAGGDDEAKTKGRSMIIYGLLGLFVMLAAWGLVWVLLNTFIGANVQPPPLPNLPTR